MTLGPRARQLLNILTRALSANKVAQYVVALSGRLELDGRKIEAKLAIPHTEIDRVSREPTCVLCVGGFPGTALQQPDMIRLLSHYFNGFGVVQRSLAIVDSMMRGFAFVTFDSPDAVERVFLHGRHIFAERILDLKKAFLRPASQPNTCTYITTDSVVFNIGVDLAIDASISPGSSTEFQADALVKNAQLVFNTGPRLPSSYQQQHAMPTFYIEPTTGAMVQCDPPMYHNHNISIQQQHASQQPQRTYRASFSAYSGPSGYQQQIPHAVHPEPQIVVSNPILPQPLRILPPLSITVTAAVSTVDSRLVSDGADHDSDVVNASGVSRLDESPVDLPRRDSKSAGTTDASSLQPSPRSQSNSGLGASHVSSFASGSSRDSTASLLRASFAICDAAGNAQPVVTVTNVADRSPKSTSPDVGQSSQWLTPLESLRELNAGSRGATSPGVSAVVAMLPQSRYPPPRSISRQANAYRNNNTNATSNNRTTSGHFLTLPVAANSYFSFNQPRSVQKNSSTQIAISQQSPSEAVHEHQMNPRTEPPSLQYTNLEPATASTRSYYPSSTYLPHATHPIPVAHVHAFQHHSQISSSAENFNLSNQSYHQYPPRQHPHYTQPQPHPYRMPFRPNPTHANLQRNSTFTAGFTTPNNSGIVQPISTDMAAMRLNTSKDSVDKA